MPLLFTHNPDNSSTLFKFQARTEGRSRKRRIEIAETSQSGGCGAVGKRAGHLLGTFCLPSSNLDNLHKSPNLIFRIT